MLEAIEDEFDAAGDSELVEDSKKVIANDLLISRGWRARKVALFCYALTGGLGIVATLSRRANPMLTATLAGLTLGLLALVIVSLGGVQVKEEQARHERART